MDVRKIKKSVVASLILLYAVLLTGCSTEELENRNFPLAIGVDLDSTDTRISYKFQNLSKVADENAKSGQNTDFYTRSSDFFTGMMEYSNDSNKMMDYNHVKVLILGEDFLEDKAALENLIDISQKDNLIAYNTLLFLAEDAGGILALDENLDTSIGSYLQEMIEGRKDYTLKDAVTVGDLYKERENKEQTLFIPVLREEGGLPVIRNYYVLSNFEAKGEISVEEAVVSYLSQGKMNKISFSMQDGINVDIQKIKTHCEITSENPLRITVNVDMEAKILNSRGKTKEEMEIVQKEISMGMEEKLYKTAKSLKEVPGIDVTNSYYKLGRYSRAAFEEYREKPEVYLKDLHAEYVVNTVFVDEKSY